jgi:predicted O-linked N-acetylglucosamine transferase (SPINDLY family)
MTMLTMPLPLGHDESVVAEAVKYAAIFHQRGMLAEAEKFYAAVLNVRPDHFNALHLLGVLRRQQGNGAEALRLTDAALKLNPRSVDALCNFGGILFALKLHDEALEAYDKALAVQRDHLDGLIGRGSTLLALNRFEQALAALDRALIIEPNGSETLNSRGQALAHLGRTGEALAAFDAILAVEADNIEAHIGRGNVLMRLHRVDEALASFGRAIELQPHHVIALHRQGLGLMTLDRHDEALESFDKALYVVPRNRALLNSYGSALLVLGRAEDALAAFDKALTITPDQPDVLKGRAAALRALGRHTEAAGSDERARVAVSHDAEAHYERGLALWALGKHEEAIASYEKASACNHPRALSRLAICRLSIADWANSGELAGALRKHIAEGSFVDPLTTLAFGLDPLVRLNAARNCIRIYTPVAKTRFVHSTLDRADKLRIAYLSADFREHPVGVAIAELLQRHDKSRFEVIGLSHGPNDAGATRARIVAAFDQFHDVASDTDRKIAERLNDLRVHIAVDLNGLSGGCRPDILAYRPAPIQVSYLGFAGTTGAPFIDYILADDTVLPFDQQPFFAEKIVHLPGCYHANDATRRISPETPTRSSLGLPEQGVVFCCFNQSYKIAAPVFDVWMRLLQQVQGSVLWLSKMNDLAQANLRREAAARGIAPDRLIFAPFVERIEDHLARHCAADLFLDTLPYNAHSTTCDALWAGLPVVTCTGAYFSGRVAASMLKAAGLPEMVTNSLEDYEALALKLATDPALLQSTRHKLKHNRPTCRLFDSDRFRHQIEAAYSTMWDIFRRGESPRSFCVEPNE